MKIHRFITDKFDLSSLFDKQVIHQINDVLKLRNDEEIILTKGDGKDLKAKLVDPQKNNSRIELSMVQNELNNTEYGKHISLFCAILKKDNFELVVQKAAEIGIKDIYPLITKRTIKTNLNLERMIKIAEEACEVAGRSIVPKVHDPIEYKSAVTLAEERNDLNCICEFNGKNYNDLNTKKSRYSVFIGPEGGFEESELSLAEKHGFVKLNLGKTTLRGETAAIVASYLLCNL